MKSGQKEIQKKIISNLGFNPKFLAEILVKNGNFGQNGNFG